MNVLTLKSCTHTRKLPEKNISLNKTCLHYATYAHLAKTTHASTYNKAAKTNTPKIYRVIDIVKKYTH